jgi:hypothetical protein
MKVIKLSDVKKFIKKLKSIGVTIARNSTIEHSLYNAALKQIIITRKRAKDIPHITLIWLYHEGGHALTDMSALKKSDNLDILDRLKRYKNNPRYSRVVGELLDLRNFPENIQTMTSTKLEIKKAFRKARTQIFMEKIANTIALTYMPASFVDTYNNYAIKAYEAYRYKLTRNRYYINFIRNSKLEEIAKTHHF